MVAIALLGIQCDGRQSPFRPSGHASGLSGGAQGVQTADYLGLVLAKTEIKSRRTQCDNQNTPGQLLERTLRYLQVGAAL